MSNPLPPVEKLPLAVRKNIRDAWENKRDEYEHQIQELVGEKWTIEVNANAIYPYADDYKPQLGNMVATYIDNFIYNLNRFTTTYGADGITELNTLCTTHTLTLAPQDSSTAFSSGGLTLQSGVLRLVFAMNRFAVNVNDASSNLAEALAAAAASPGPNEGRAYNLLARQGVRANYDPEIESVLDSIRDLVAMPDLQLKPNFDANAKALVDFAALDKASGDGWERNFGRATYSYFDGLRYALDRNGFKDDDMMQEAFKEVVEFGVAGVRIVDRLSGDTGKTKKRGNEVVVEEGCLWIQTTVDYWYTNVDDAAAKLMDIL